MALALEAKARGNHIKVLPSPKWSKQYMWDYRELGLVTYTGEFAGPAWDMLSTGKGPGPDNMTDRKAKNDRGT